MAKQLIRKSPLDLANAYIEPQDEFTIRRATAPYNDEIRITQAVNKKGKPTRVTVNQPPVGSYKGYKYQRVDLPSKWQRYKDPFGQSQSLVSEDDVRRQAIERWKKIPDDKRFDINVAYGQELDPFDFSLEDASETTLDEDIDYLNSEYFTPYEWEILDKVLKRYGY